MAVGVEGVVLHTTNSGTNWLSQVSEVSVKLSSVNFVDQNTGWVVGYKGAILKTTNGGATFIADEINPSKPNSYMLSQTFQILLTQLQK